MSVANSLRSMSLKNRIFYSAIFLSLVSVLSLVWVSMAIIDMFQRKIDSIIISTTMDLLVTNLTMVSRNNCRSEPSVLFSYRHSLCTSGSGLYAQIVGVEGASIWRSPSAAGRSSDGSEVPVFQFPKNTETGFGPIKVEGKEFLFSKTYHEKADGMEPRYIEILADRRQFPTIDLWTLFHGVDDIPEISGIIVFLRVNIGMIGVMGITVAVFLVLAVNFPITRLGNDLEAILNSDSIDGGLIIRYVPAELTRLIDRILSLRRSERDELDRIRKLGVDYDNLYGSIARTRKGLHDVYNRLFVVWSGLKKLHSAPQGVDGEGLAKRLEPWINSVEWSCEELSEYTGEEVKVLHDHADSLIRKVNLDRKARARSIDVAVVARRVCEVYQQENERLVIVLDMRGSATWTMDELHLRKILENLIGNACKYAKKKISVSVCGSGSSLKIAVEDDGRGINLMDPNWVWEIGRQIDASEQGSGVGLYLVRNLAVEIYGGEVDAFGLDRHPTGGLFEVKLRPEAG